MTGNAAGKLGSGYISWTRRPASSQVHLQSWSLKQNYLGKQNAVYNYAPLETRYSNRRALLSSAQTVHVIWNLAWPFVTQRGAISHANVTNFARFRTSDTKRNDNKIQREKNSICYHLPDVISRGCGLFFNCSSLRLGPIHVRYFNVWSLRVISQGLTDIFVGHILSRCLCLPNCNMSVCTSMRTARQANCCQGNRWSKSTEQRRTNKS